MNSERLFQKDQSESTLDLSEIQRRLIQFIPESCISFDKKFYQVMALNVIGASICVKKRGVGVIGLSILCQNFMK